MTMNDYNHVKSALIGISGKGFHLTDKNHKYITFKYRWAYIILNLGHNNSYVSTNHYISFSNFKPSMPINNRTNAGIQLILFTYHFAQIFTSTFII